ncbi:hypothetical protein J4442_01010 [Candidatus Woesearchaeota archaeon]|nr:hypothetical protein [Candidatus Woesearchaeota archaeon]
MKIDYENLKPEDLENEEVELEIDKDAFKGPLICKTCNKKMQNTVIDFDLPGKEVTLHLEAFKCTKCNKESLSGDQAEKFDKMLVLIDALKQKTKFKFERAANYDGKTWFVRFPNDLTKTWDKTMITDIIPITNKDFFIHIKNKKD